MAGEEASEEDYQDTVRPVILSSWKRSRHLGVDPATKKLPKVVVAGQIERSQEQEDLVYISIPYFETIVKAWPEEEFGILLSDSAGNILHTTSHSLLLERTADFNVAPGAGMAEEHIGTAVANLVLSQGRLEYVIGPEHYCKAFHEWATIGAPIHHPLSQEIIGTVVVGSKAITHPHALEMVTEVAQQIGHRLHREELVRRSSLLDEYHRFQLRHPQDTVLAVDGRGYICGVSPLAHQFFERPEQLLERSLLRIPDLQVEGFRSSSQNREYDEYSLTMTVRGRAQALDVRAIPVRGERQQAGSLLVISAAASKHRPPRPATTSWAATHTFADLIGNAPPFEESLTLARQAAQHDFPALLLGESGTGKELLAQAIHTASPRQSGPFVAVNCGVANDELLAAELFGYVDGAFTGAARGGRKGKIELAHNGTLFLDEVVEMPLKMQVSLLRVLEEGKVTRVGSERPTPVNIRVIAASHNHLKYAVQEQRFRHDLYHRIAAFPIELPPLRERTSDIPALTKALLAQIGFGHLKVTQEALTILSAYAWPGNVRELRNVLLRAAHQTLGHQMTPEALPNDITGTPAVLPVPQGGSLKETEQELIRQALTETGGNIAQAATQLGIHRATLYRKLKRYGLTSANTPPVP